MGGIISTFGELDSNIHFLSSAQIAEILEFFE
jgi:hypothetical protein